jgi:hypothetical protein
MTTYNSNEEFFAALRSLIDDWCDRRCLKPLSLVLGAYLAFAGLTDSWGILHDALVRLRAQAQWADLSDQEMETVEDLIRATERVLYR